MRRLDRQRVQQRPDFPIDEPTSRLEPMTFDPQEVGLAPLTGRHAKTLPERPAERDFIVVANE